VSGVRASGVIVVFVRVVMRCVVVEGFSGAGGTVSVPMIAPSSVPMIFVKMKVIGSMVVMLRIGV
jgi:hypothetical protein